MKLNKLFLGAIAALASAAMVACSDDAPDVNTGGENGDGDGSNSYLAVNIVPTTAASRGDAGGWENGSDTENTVKKIRFYFFNAGGDVATVKSDPNDKTKRLNYYDWTPTTSETSRATVEKTLQAILVINTKEGDGLPGMILAVINPDEANLPTGNPNLSTLRGAFSNYAATANAADPVFVMSNSVYAKGNEVIKATKLLKSDFKTTSGEATTNPVKIYVERTMAKVRAKLNLAAHFTTQNIGGQIMIPAMTKNTNNGTTTYSQIIIGDGEENTPVYIKLLGWNVTADMPAANLSKHINTAWIGVNDLLTTINWNDPDNFRSYWADVNNIGTSFEQIYNKWDNLNLPLTTTENSIYVNENAQKPEGENVKIIDPTKIIVRAQICNETGTPLTVCEYGGVKFADNATLDALKTAKLNFLNNGTVSYYKKVADDKFTKIGISDIEIIKSTGTESNMYLGKAQLTTDASANTVEWYTAQNDADEITDLNQLTESSSEAINTALSQQSNALVYTNGVTYYYADIEHINKRGIVRNHIYDINIQGFYGLGTPVYDTDDIIIPETPSTQDSYLAAQINILQWRVMSQTVNFGE